MLGASDGTAVTSQNQYLSKVCPASGNTVYDDVVDSDGVPFGQLIVDNGICVTSTGRGNVVTASNAGGAVYGGAAQDFGTYKTAWETYGWSLFKMPAPPTDQDVNWAWIQGINLHLIGAVGSGHDGSECSVTGISFSIFPADPTSKEVSSATPVYSTNIDVTAGANHNAFTWGTAPGNVTTIFYTDIYDSADDAVDARGFNLTAGTYYWLRVKVFSELTAAKRCFVFWGLSSNVGNDAGMKAKWQERVGGASGYSTNCLGAETSPTAFPGQYQSFWNCWNNGVGNSAYTLSTAPLRRCSTFRQSTNPPLVATDCTKTPIGKGGAQFNDFNYAFTGMQGTPADVGIP